MPITVERFHLRDYRPYLFTETKENICIKIEFISQRFSLGHQHGRHFFVLGHQNGRCDGVLTICEPASHARQTCEALRLA